jgi:hypothetical protein
MAVSVTGVLGTTVPVELDVVVVVVGIVITALCELLIRATSDIVPLDGIVWVGK